MYQQKSKSPVCAAILRKFVELFRKCDSSGLYSSTPPILTKTLLSNMVTTTPLVLKNNYSMEVNTDTSITTKYSFQKPKN